MSMIIKEDFANGGLKVTWNSKKDLSVKEKTDNNKNVLTGNSITTEYEALHVGLTRNNTFYTSESLMSIVPTWTDQYNRPVIMHHKDEDGVIIGRIHHAEIKESNTLSGTPALMLTATISDEEGKKGAIDGRLATVSVGATVHEAYCSICGQNIAEYGECEHTRGFEYDGKMCFWRIVRMEAKELSYVIVPSDKFAQQTKVYKQESNGNKIMITESLKENAKMSEKLTPEETMKIEQEKIIAEKKLLEEENKTLKEDLSKAVKKQEEQDLVLADLNLKLSGFQAEIATVKAEIEVKESAIKAANVENETIKETLALKEAAINAFETKVIKEKMDKRLSLIESVVSMRAELNKRAVAKEDLEKKSDDYLEEHILDLKDELSVKEAESRKKDNNVTSPGFTDNNENVEKGKRSSNINVEESLAAMMGGLLKPSRY